MKIKTIPILISPIIIAVTFTAVLQGKGIKDIPGSKEIEKAFSAGVFTSKNHSSLPYRIRKPSVFQKSKKYPLILFLHGSDERGDDNRTHLFVGLNILASEKHMKQYPCFVVAPQCPSNMRWVEVNWKRRYHKMPNKPSPALDMSLELVQYLIKKLPIDAKRIYIVGYSMGGFGVWDAIQRRPDIFAAAVPACGGGDETLAYRIADIPIWAFHGLNDTIVKVERSRKMINAIIKAGGVPRYTEYRTVGHFCWALAFGDQEMLKWLFKQKKK